MFSLKGLAIAASLALLTAPAAYASHGRGAAIVPSVSASGLLTVDMKSFWRQDSFQGACSFPHDCISAAVTGPTGYIGSVGDFTGALDMTDSRYSEINQTDTLQLTAPGLYTIEWSSCCWISTVPKIPDAIYGTRSTIYWDGQTASAPIIFDLENIQIEVERGVAYRDNLDVIGGPGLIITYGNTTSGLTGVGAANQATGYSIDAAGNINITAGGTETYSDQVAGGDQAFDGKITARNAAGQEMGSVEFYWIFDGVDDAPDINRAPTVSDIVVNALVGDTINETVTASDPDGDTVTLHFANFVGTGGVLPPNAQFNPGTGQFTWDSTGFGPGTYIATIQGSDGLLTDNGTITINLTQGDGNPDPNAVPLPATALLLGSVIASLGGAGAIRRRRK